MIANFIQLIRFLLIILFLYAGVSKLLELTTFIQQLYQSPVIPQPIVPYLAYFLPSAEIILGIMFMINRFMRFGFMIAFILMLFFSLYLIGLNIFFTKVPCACGGILGNIDYQTHIVFNIIFTLLAGFAFIKSFNKNNE